MKIWIVSAWLVAVGFVASSACAQQASVADDVREGHRLAILICSYCHVAAADQADKPILQPPGPPFASIARRKDVSADSLRAFLTTTHRDLSRPQGMPNPELLDFQVKQVAAYILSLRDKP
jgi:mono/diheme cytochrome c family protein